MRIHCDYCGAALESEQALKREWDGEVFWFCDQKCATSSRHIDAEPSAAGDEHGAGPVAAGDLDEAET